MASPDGSRILPAPSVVDAAGVVWTISYLFAQRNGYNTTAHASELLWWGGSVYVRGRNLHWWRHLGGNAWSDVGAADPSAGGGGNVAVGLVGQQATTDDAPAAAGRVLLSWAELSLPAA